MALELKFGAAGLAAMPAVEQVHDPSRLQAILQAMLINGMMKGEM